jgi:hypothetical protein
MTTDDALLFIDAKDLLASISEQTEHIFVTQQVVDEVKRQKIGEAAGFLTRQFAGLKQTYKLPDHLFGTTEEESKSIHQQINRVSNGHHGED